MSIKTLFEEKATEIIVATVITGATGVVASNLDMKQDFKELRGEFTELKEAVVDLQENSYNTEYKEVLYELAESTTHDQIIADVSWWKEDNKGASWAQWTRYVASPAESICWKSCRKKLLLMHAVS
jgi:hypothetical protein